MLQMVGIAPHPPIIIPEIGRGDLHKAQKTVDAMKLLSAQIRDAQPELLVIISPHGQVVREGPAVLGQEELSGDFGRFGFPGVRITMKTDRELLRLLVEEAGKEPLQPVLLGDEHGGYNGGDMLDHGATVPLYYLQQAGVDAPGLHVTFCFRPLRELYAFGRTLRRAIDERGLRTALVASGDLSHRLIPGAPAGFNRRGAEFDRLLVELIGAGRVEDILDIDPRLVEEAGECGLRAFVIALGALDGEDFKADVLSYEGPFGVGYLVAALRPARLLETAL